MEPTDISKIFKKYKNKQRKINQEIEKKMN